MTDHRINRRRFLQVAGATTLGLALGVPAARGQEAEYDGPLLAVFNATGGWDPTYLMDPKGTPELNRLYSDDQIRQFGAHLVAPTAAHIAEGAMSNETFFERHGDRLLVVNGIDVSVNNHSPCSRYIATGELNSLVYPTLPALFAAVRRPEVPLAFLTFGDYSATGNIIAQTRIPYLSSLDRLGTIGYSDRGRTRSFMHERVTERIRETLADASMDPASLPKVARARSFVHGAQQSSQQLDRLSEFLPEARPADHYYQQLEIALTGFRSGLAVSANFKLGNFDSHDTNDVDQMRLIPKYLDGVDYFVRRAQELGLADRLVIVMQSEMGRTPWYNETGGKDHWSVTSMMAMGAGIRGGRVVGMTSVNPESGFDQSPTLLDPATLALSPNGARVRPEHLQQALREHLGIAEHPLSARFALKLPPEEHLQGLF